MYELSEFKFHNDLNKWDYSGGLSKNIPLDTDVKPLKLSTDKRKPEDVKAEEITNENIIEPVIALHRESDKEFEEKRKTTNYKSVMTDDYFFQIVIPIVLYFLICVFRYQFIEEDSSSILGAISDMLLLSFPLWGIFATSLIICLLIFAKARNKMKYAEKNNPDVKNDPLYKKAKSDAMASAVTGVTTAVIATQLMHKKIKDNLEETKVKNNS